MGATKHWIFFLIVFSLACAKTEFIEDIRKEHLEELLALFTERRIDLNLRSNTVPKNKELFFAIARELSLNPQKAFFKLKEVHPQIFTALFEKEKGD